MSTGAPGQSGHQPGRVIATRADLKFFLDADMYSSGVTKWSIVNRWSQPILHCQRLLRYVEYHEANPSPITMPYVLVLKWRLKRLLLKLGFTIPRRVFGPGLSIAHYGTIVINPKAVVGRNCRLHAGITIGQLHGRSCTIGDNVWIGPGAVIYGDVTIGDDVVIGANAVVGRDVESGVTVAGVPAEVVSETDSSRLMTDGCAVAGSRQGYQPQGAVPEGSPEKE